MKGLSAAEGGSEQGFQGFSLGSESRAAEVRELVPAHKCAPPCDQPQAAVVPSYMRQTVQSIQQGGHQSHAALTVVEAHGAAGGGAALHTELQVALNACTNKGRGEQAQL